MKLSDRCRKEARDFYLYDNKDCVEWKAADLLDECEKALLEISDATAGLENPTCISVGILSRATLAKLRTAQEKADEAG